MKSFIKRWLLAGMALSLAALTARRCKQQEIEGALDRPHPDRSPLPPVSGGSSQSSAPAHGPTGPLPHSPIVSVTFSGTVVRNGSRLALREVAGVLYPLDGTPRAWSFEGESVRVTGKMDLSTRMLHVDAIEAAVL